MRYSLSPSGRPSAASLRDTDRLDDLEDGRTAHDEDKQRQQPRSHGVLLLGGLGRLGHVAALGDVTAGLLVGHADSLLGSHCSVVFFAGEVLASYVLKEERERDEIEQFSTLIFNIHYQYFQCIIALSILLE